MSNQMPGGIKIIRKKKKVQDEKFSLPFYMTYVLTFPDGDQWTRQEQFMGHELDLKLKNMIIEHRRTNSEWKHRAMALWKAGECWWKDEAGVEHLIMIEKEKREERWGITKEDFATFKHGVTGEEL